MNQLEKELKDKKEELKGLDRSIVGLDKEFKSLQISQQKAEKDYQESKTQFDVISERRQTLEQQSFEKAKEFAIETNKSSVLENDIEQIDFDVKEKTKQIAELDKDLKKNERSSEALKKEIEKLESNKSEEREKENLLKENIQKIEEELVKINRSLDSKSNEHTLLSSMIENLEGFPESIKFLSKNWNKSIPILSDILDVDAESKGTIEHFLDPYLNYYLADNVKQAAKAIQLLGKSQKGKAQFFLLDKIPNVSPSKSNDAAVQVVKVDKKYQKSIYPNEATLLKDCNLFQAGLLVFLKVKRLGGKRP